jgi:predicted dehydrogenase
MAVRIGLIGLGFIGRTHLEALGELPEAQLSAVCDIRPEQMELAPEGAARFRNPDDLFRSGQADAVDLCVPTDLHAELAEAAFAAGLAVFCEKPLALSYGQAVRVVRASREAGRPLGIGHCLRYWPEYEIIKEMIDSRCFGRAERAVFTRVSAPPDWSWDGWLLDSARSGCAAMDLHVHDADLVQWLFGLPQAVRVHGAFADDGGVRHVTANYEFGRRGPMVVAEGGWLEAETPFQMSAAVRFDRASVEYCSSSTPTLTVYTPDGPRQPAVPQRNAYAEELRDFCGAVEEGRPMARISPDEAARAVGLVETEILAAREGGAIPLRRVIRR